MRTVNTVKRVFAAIIAALCAAVLLCSCVGGTKDAEGGDLIKKAREAYRALDSAKVVMTNTSTNEVEQEFTFKYDEKDILIFSYKGKSEKSEYAQYNNGAELFTYQNGEFSYVQKGEEGFALYTRDTTHPQADEGMILYSPAAVSEASVSDENGVTHIRHVYDVSKISAQTESGEVTGFYADYYFKDDDLQYFVETTETEENGSSRTSISAALTFLKRPI